MRRGSFWAFVGVFMFVSVWSGPYAGGGVLKSVSGPGDLDLSGTIYYGINLGGTSDVLVGGKWLESDNDGDPAPVGYLISTTNIWASGWGYGSLTDPGLQKTYDSMRWWPNALEMSFRYLPPVNRSESSFCCQKDTGTKASADSTSNSKATPNLLMSIRGPSGDIRTPAWPIRSSR